MAVLCEVYGTTFKGITERDVHVYWHKDYYGEGMLAGSSEMKKLLFQLEGHSPQGPSLDKAYLLPWVALDPNNEVVAASRLALKDCCMNYSKEACCSVLQMFSPGNTTEETFLYNDENRDHVAEDVIENFRVNFPTPDSNIFAAQECNSYSDLLSAAKEIAAVLDGSNYTADIQSHVRGSINRLLAECKAMVYGPVSTTCSVVSSAVPAHKKRKTHGTSHY